MQTKKETYTIWQKHQNIKKIDIHLLTKALSDLLSAGIPILTALKIIADTQKKLKMRRLIESLHKQIDAGCDLSSSLKKYPKYFSSLFCNLVHAGEISGSLTIILNNLAFYQEKSAMNQRKIKKALIYPATVFIVATLITVVIMLIVVPQFQNLFSNFGADLPLLTQLIIHLAHFLQMYYQNIIFWGISGIFILYKLYKNQVRFRNFCDKASLKLPVVGKIFMKHAIIQFSRTLAMMLNAGIPILESLKSTASATGNAIFEFATQQIAISMQQGKTLTQALALTKTFPPMTVQMIGIGEESAQLASMLESVANYYEHDVDNLIDSINILIEPLLMIFLGVSVGGLIIAMYLPIFNISSVV